MNVNGASNPGCENEQLFVRKQVSNMTTCQGGVHSLFSIGHCLKIFFFILLKDILRI